MSLSWGNSLLFAINSFLNHGWVLNFYKIVFDCIYWHDAAFFFFSLSIHWIRLVAFWMSSQSWIPNINPRWSWYILPFVYCWTWLANNLLRILCRYSQEIVACGAFYTMFVSGFGIRAMLTLYQLGCGSASSLF